MMKDFTLLPLGGGALALWRRPRVTHLPELREAGVTHLATLLAEREGAVDLGAAARAAGLTWLWIPMQGGAVPGRERTTELRPKLAELRAALAAGAKVVVHCSAGIHRTGMIGYALLRSLPLPATEARAKLAELRVVTAEGVGRDRMAWGDALADGTP
jgi:protein-tyrosine phosphatase